MVLECKVSKEIFNVCQSHISCISGVKDFWRQQQCESDNGQMFQIELCETEDVFTERILATHING